MPNSYSPTLQELLALHSRQYTAFSLGYMVRSILQSYFVFYPEVCLEDLLPNSLRDLKE